MTSYAAVRFGQSETSNDIIAECWGYGDSLDGCKASARNALKDHTGNDVEYANGLYRHLHFVPLTPLLAEVFVSMSMPCDISYLNLAIPETDHP
jgi:hypothetical protein